MVQRREAPQGVTLRLHPPQAPRRHHPQGNLLQADGRRHRKQGERERTGREHRTTSRERTRARQGKAYTTQAHRQESEHRTKHREQVTRRLTERWGVSPHLSQKPNHYDTSRDIQMAPRERAPGVRPGTPGHRDKPRSDCNRRGEPVPQYLSAAIPPPRGMAVCQRSRP